MKSKPNDENLSSQDDIVHDLEDQIGRNLNHKITKNQRCTKRDESSTIHGEDRCVTKNDFNAWLSQQALVGQVSQLTHETTDLWILAKSNHDAAYVYQQCNLKLIAELKLTQSCSSRRLLSQFHLHQGFRLAVKSFKAWKRVWQIRYQQRVFVQRQRQKYQSFLVQQVWTQWKMRWGKCRAQRNLTCLTKSFVHHLKQRKTKSEQAQIFREWKHQSLVRTRGRVWTLERKTLRQTARVLQSKRYFREWTHQLHLAQSKTLEDKSAQHHVLHQVYTILGERCLSVFIE